MDANSPTNDKDIAESDRGGPSDLGIKKSRRTTVYPNVNSTNKVEKPFSKSAAKRNSVMALGSIEHLQHYFTKAGISAAQKPRGAKGSFVHALGPAALPSLAVPSFGHEEQLTFALPPPTPPAPPSPSSNIPPPPVETSPYTVDPEALKPGVIQDLENVENVWQIRSRSSPLPLYSSPSGSSTLGLITAASSSPDSSHFDVLHVLKITTRAIRSVRNFLLALPDDHPALHFGTNLIEAFRKHSLSRPGYASRKVASGSGTPRISFGRPGATPSTTASPSAPVLAPPDPLSVIRRSALDVLAALRQIEESSRLPLDDDAYTTMSQGDGVTNAFGFPQRLRHTQSAFSIALEREVGGSDGDGGSDTGGSSTLVSSNSPLSQQLQSPLQPPSHSPKPDIIPLKIEGRDKTVPVWADLEENIWEDFDDEDEKEDPWDERLVVGGGWLYRQDIDPTSLERERKVIQRYLDVVDEVLFGNSIPTTPGQRGWSRAKLDIVASSSKSRNKGRTSFGTYDGSGSPRKGSATLASNDGALRLISPTVLEAMSAMLTDEPKSLGSAIDEGEDDDEEENDVPDEVLPEWAKRSAFVTNSLDRLYAFLLANLPAELASHLPSPSSCDQAAAADPFSAPSVPASPSEAVEWRGRLLEALSDGQILCTAYNHVVRRSRNPWGYIDLENIHDLLGLTHDPEKDKDLGELMDFLVLGSAARAANLKAKGSWTFRRIENLRYWAGALKLRYMIPFISVPANSPEHAAAIAKHQRRIRTISRPFLPNSPLTMPLYFDPKIVASREPGWEVMFERVLTRWLDVVLSEKRTKV